jgi:hypothetical protein
MHKAFLALLFLYPLAGRAQEDLRTEVARQREEIEKLKKDQVRGLPGLRFTGFVQVDAVLMRQSSVDEVDQSTGEPLNENRFTLRRGRLRVDYQKGYFSSTLAIDVNTIRGLQVRPHAADVTVRWPMEQDERLPFIAASVGLLRIPFGFEVPLPAPQQLFVERPIFAGALFPGFWDMGARIHGGFRALRYAVAAMNGHPTADRQFALRDPNESKDLVARVGIETKVIEPVKVIGGLSLVTGRGFHRGTPSTKDTVVWRDNNEDGLVDVSELRPVPGTAATPSEGYKRFALGSDLRVFVEVPRLGQLAVMGEVVWAQNLDRGLVPSNPVTAGRDVRQLGWYVGFTQEITRWAQVGVRYDRYDPDADARDQQGLALVPKDATFTDLSLAAAFRWSPARFVAQYDHVTNALGRDVNGAPSTLKDDRFLIRSEVVW